MLYYSQVLALYVGGVLPIITLAVQQSDARMTGRNATIMFKAIGFLIMLWGLSVFFSQSFEAADDAGEQSFRAIEAAAVASTERLEMIDP